MESGAALGPALDGRGGRSLKERTKWKIYGEKLKGRTGVWKDINLKKKGEKYAEVEGNIV